MQPANTWMAGGEEGISESAAFSVPLDTTLRSTSTPPVGPITRRDAPAARDTDYLGRPLRRSAPTSSAARSSSATERARASRASEPLRRQSMDTYLDGRRKRAEQYAAAERAVDDELDARGAAARAQRGQLGRQSGYDSFPSSGLELNGGGAASASASAAQPLADLMPVPQGESDELPEGGLNAFSPHQRL